MAEDDLAKIAGGFIAGMILTLTVCIFASGMLDNERVENGWMTNRNKVYTITLYDTLDKPEKE